MGPTFRRAARQSSPAGLSIWPILASVILASIVWLSTAIAPSVAAELTLLAREPRNDPTRLDFTPVCNARLDGEIRAGDAEAMAGKLATFRADPRVSGVEARIGRQLSEVSITDLVGSLRQVDRQFYALCLSSDGGDVKEAFKIAQLFRGWMMVVGLDDYGQPEHCHSACAIIFMSAKRRDGLYESNAHKRYPGRFLHYKSSLGFHAPRLEFPPGHSGTVTTEQAKASYANAVSTMRKLVADQPSPHIWDRATLGRHRGTDFPADLLIEMLTTTPEQMSEIEFVAEAVDWGIELFGFPPPKAVTDRLAMTICTNLAWKRCDHSESQDRCDDSFVTAAQVPANRVAGVKRLARLAPGTKLEKTAPDVIAADQRALLDMLKTWIPKSQTLWPRTGRGNVGIEAVTLQAGPTAFGATQPCALVMTFDGDRLKNVEAQTMNGSLRYWLKTRAADEPPLGIFDEYHVKAEAAVLAGTYRADTPEHIGLTRMLPGKARLVDLDGDPWAWSNAGHPVTTRRNLGWTP